MPSSDIEAKRASFRKHYWENRDAYLERHRERREARRNRNREVVNARKAKPCTDCGNTYPPHVMQFDHINDDKEANVSKMVWDCVPVERLEAEMNKCELVCANCHADRTWRRQHGDV